MLPIFYHCFNVLVRVNSFLKCFELFLMPLIDYHNKKNWCIMRRLIRCDHRAPPSSAPSRASIFSSTSSPAGALLVMPDARCQMHAACSAVAHWSLPCAMRRLVESGPFLILSFWSRLKRWSTWQGQSVMQCHSTLTLNIDKLSSLFLNWPEFISLKVSKSSTLPT